jgi:hypothetical protein
MNCTGIRKRQSCFKILVTFYVFGTMIFKMVSNVKLPQIMWTISTRLQDVTFHNIVVTYSVYCYIMANI